VEVGFDDEGRVLALRDAFVHDTGAYTTRGLVVPLLTAGTMSGPYRIPNIEVSFASVYTNRCPSCPTAAPASRRPCSCSSASWT
jgi:aerobic carbon-monoxide dehydrogenase large subunit